jgi:hypothetical protein
VIIRDCGQSKGISVAGNCGDAGRGIGDLDARLPFSSQSAPCVRLALGPMPLRFDERQAAAYTACSNAIRVSNTCSSLAGRICIMMTAVTRRFGSTQKKVLWTPAQERL